MALGGPRLDWRRHLRASLRDLFVLLREFRLTLLLFAVLMLVGTAVVLAAVRIPRYRAATGLG